ncbi:energy transducer TonB [Leptolyngbya sp. FACHB-261]|uniref:energy transducer TonB n=1 Tax=Leptolyngbya sp. FACHB-261 TaxID=2692806 RepID=UPI0016828D04|nr:energy transducer TonB [Leptolyngbya sp. FACHB-261]MBD2101194.1 TonB family protein [Leptolyngbya sp. FACHB-261]
MTLRRHTDPPELWGLVLTGSLAAHATLALSFPQTLVSVAQPAPSEPIAIELVDVGPTAAFSSTGASAEANSGASASSGSDSPDTGSTGTADSSGASSAPLNSAASGSEPLQGATTPTRPPDPLTQPQVTTQPQPALSSPVASQAGRPAATAAEVSGAPSSPAASAPAPPAASTSESPADLPVAAEPLPTQPDPAQNPEAQPLPEAGATTEPVASDPNQSLTGTLEFVSPELRDVPEVPPTVQPNQPLPPYPAEALRLGQRGRTELMVELDQTGRVVNVSVLQSSGYAELDEAARSTIATWQFSPALSGGIARDCRVMLAVRFEPGGGS